MAAECEWLFIYLFFVSFTGSAIYGGCFLFEVQSFSSISSPWQFEAKGRPVPTLDCGWQGESDLLLYRKVQLHKHEEANVCEHGPVAKEDNLVGLGWKCKVSGKGTEERQFCSERPHIKVAFATFADSFQVHVGEESTGQVGLRVQEQDCMNLPWILTRKGTSSLFRFKRRFYKNTILKNWTSGCSQTCHIHWQ